MSNIKLGVKAKDKVTGFEGIVIAKTEWLTGCDQYVLKQKAKEGVLPDDGQWFDEGMLVVIGEGIHAKEVKSKRPGGPKHHDTRKC